MTQVRIEDINVKIDNLRNDIEDLRNKLVSLIQKRDKLVKQQFNAVLDGTEDKLALLLAADVDIEGVYEQLEGELSKLGGQLSVSGSYAKVGTYCLNLSLYKTSAADLEKTKAALERVIPLLPLIDGNIPGDESLLSKSIGFHDHTLSEFGSYRLVFGENEVILTKTVYGRTKEWHKTNDLDSMLQHLAKNHNMVSKESWD